MHLECWLLILYGNYPLFHVNNVCTGYTKVFGISIGHFYLKSIGIGLVCQIVVSVHH